MTAIKLVAISSALCITLSARAQGTFENLDFESANPISAGNPEVPSAVTFASALPGWSGSLGGAPATQALLNNYDLGAASIDIFGPGWNSTGPGIIDGNYTVYLQAGAGPGGDGSYNASLYQNGTIPVNAASLQFKAWSQYTPAYFALSFAGNSLAYSILSSGTSPSGQSYYIYGANLASYAGQTGQLEFTAIDNNPPGNIEFDDISFSTQSVPEPSPFLLTGFGGTLFALHRRFAPKRK